MGRKVALDSAVFIYVLNAHSVFGPPSRALLQATESGRIESVSSQLIYMEVLASPKLSNLDVVKIKRFLAGSNVTFAPVDEDVLVKAAQLRREHGLKLADAIHIASALINKATHFVTNDYSLLKKAIKGIQLTGLNSIDKITA